MHPVAAQVGDEVLFRPSSGQIVEGIVTDVGWYRTTIRSFEREIYNIPNSGEQLAGWLDDWMVTGWMVVITCKTPFPVLVVGGQRSDAHGMRVACKMEPLGVPETAPHAAHAPCTPPPAVFTRSVVLNITRKNREVRPRLTTPGSGCC